MKPVLIFASVISTFFISCDFGRVKGRNGVVYKNAQDYNDYIITRQTKVINNILDFVKTAETNLDSAEAILDESVNEINVYLTEIGGMPAFKGDSALRGAAVNSFLFYKNVFSDEYKQLINYRKKGADLTTADQNEMTSLVRKITLEEEKYDKAFHNAQSDFARENNMQLKENELQKKINKPD